MAIHSTSGRRRNKARTADQIIAPQTTDTPEDAPMQQQSQQPPQQPAVVIDDEGLRLIWGTRDKPLADAHASAQLAEPFEQQAAQNRNEAAGAREEILRLQEGILRAQERAAELEAAAGRAEHSAKLHRQDEVNHLKNAQQIATTVDFLHNINGKLHPAERQQRMEQQAAANAVGSSPLTDPLGTLVSSSPDPTVTAAHPPVAAGPGS